MTIRDGNAHQRYKITIRTVSDGIETEKNKNLGSWVWYQRQRELYHKKTLSSKHFLQLEGIGLEWIVPKRIKI